MDSQNGIVVRRAADHAWVWTSMGEVECLLRRGLFKSADRLAVGERVRVAHGTSAKWAIQEIFPRTSFLPRPHLANITQAVVVTAFQEPPPNLALLDRLLMVSQAAGLRAILVWNKVDLVGGDGSGASSANSAPKDAPEKYRRLGYPVFWTSAKKGIGVEDFQKILRGERSVFMGSSGVGKTSLLRAIDPSIHRPIGKLSVAGQHGRHTTTRSEIFFVGPEQEIGIADSPGFDWVTLLPDSAEGIQRGFPELENLRGTCGFSDCSHMTEPRCAVRAGVEAGTIWGSRYESYKKFMEELKARPKTWEKRK